jgi:hypothetical protein
LRLCAWVYLVASVVAGIALVVVATSSGLAGMLLTGYVIIIGPIVALLGVAVWAVLMVVANMAGDLEAIRDHLWRR